MFTYFDYLGTSQEWTSTHLYLLLEGTAYKVNNASTLQLKTKYVFVFKTI